jgi:hypothetical protein
MNIKNKYCLLSSLTTEQIKSLTELMPASEWFYFEDTEAYIGFSNMGNSGTWKVFPPVEAITYKEMLSLLGAEEEQLVPHVHQKEIIAWANGEEIELFLSSASPPEWVALPSPEWAMRSSYRVKPKLTPTQLRIKELTEELQKLHEQDAVESGIGLVMGGVGCQQFED